MKFRVASKVLNRKNYFMQHRNGTVDKAVARFSKYLSTHCVNPYEFIDSLTEVEKIAYTKKNRHILLLRAILGERVRTVLSPPQES